MNEMQLKRFGSIDNHYSEKTVGYYESMGYTDSNFVWCAQEKAHGANLSFHTTDGENWATAKRSSFLSEGESFHNWQQVLQETLPALNKFWQEVIAAYNKDAETQEEGYLPITQLSLYGELIGGRYDHPEVNRVVGASKVQDGIQYSPKNVFYLFDIRVVYSDERVEFLSPQFVEEMEQYGFIAAKVLQKGTFKEALTWNNVFPTTIPEQLGLPPIEDNITEGLVLKPEHCVFMPSGSRVILKSKNPAWLEKASKKKKVKTPKKLPDDVQEQLDLLASYATRNRLLNVISKIGNVTRKDTGKLIEDLSQDALTQFYKEHLVDGHPMHDTKFRKQVTKPFSSVCAGVVNEYFKSL